MRCSCPAKVMLAGEYAVVNGGPAVLAAVSARAQASIADTQRSLSPFLAAALEVLMEHFGKASPEAVAARCMQVDTSEFYQANNKLGLGSSAAVTVAAIGAALSARAPALDVDLVHQLAARAHGMAQQAMGARGSGADIATCTYGGVLHFQAGSPPQPLTLPSDLHLRFPWTGISASTAPLVAKVRAFALETPGRYQEHSTRISDCASALSNATHAQDAIDVIASAGKAVADLGTAVGIDLWLPIHSQLAELAKIHGGSLKPTGAGAGDLALAAFSSQGAAQAFEENLSKLEIFCPKLVVDNEGVRLHA